jgi:hypothetical protein
MAASDDPEWKAKSTDAKLNWLRDEFERLVQHMNGPLAQRIDDAHRKIAQAAKAASQSEE